MRHLMTVDASPVPPERLDDAPVGRPARRRDAPAARGRGPEEIALDAWLEDAGPYVSLRGVFGSVEAAVRGPEPRGRTGPAHSTITAPPLAVTAFD